MWKAINHKTLTILFCLHLITANGFCSDLNGRYRHIAMMPKSVATNDKIEYSQIEAVYLLELRDNKGVRYSITYEGDDSSDLTHFKGVWAINGGRLFYLLKSTGWHFVGSSKVDAIHNSLKLSSFLGPPLAQKLEMMFIRDESVEFPFGIAADIIPSMRDRLDKIIKNIPEVKFVGAKTQEDFKKRFYSAIKIEDVSELLALTYLRQHEYIDDPTLHYYLEYLSGFLSPGGEYQIEEATEEKFLEKLQSAKKFGYGFPSHISPKGFFWMRKKGGGTALFYGVVEGRWALIDSPTRND